MGSRWLSLEILTQAFKQNRSERPLKPCMSLNSWWFNPAIWWQFYVYDEDSFLRDPLRGIICYVYFLQCYNRLYCCHPLPHYFTSSRVVSKTGYHLKTFFYDISYLPSYSFTFLYNFLWSSLYQFEVTIVRPILTRHVLPQCGLLSS